MNRIFKATLLAMLLILATVGVAQAQTSATQNVTLNYSIAEFATLSVSPTSVNFTGSGTSATAPPISVSISYGAGSTRSTVGYDLYFASTTALKGTSNPSNVIPVNDVFASDSGSSAGALNTQPTAAACTQSEGAQWDGAIPPAGSDCLFVHWNFGTATGDVPNEGTVSDTINLSLQGLPANLPVDTYVGAVVLYAGIQ